MPSPFDILKTFTQTEKDPDSPFLKAMKILVNDKNPSLIQKHTLSIDELNLLWDIGTAMSIISEPKEVWTTL